MKKTIITAALLSTTLAAPAMAGTGDPVAVGGGFKLDPIVDARLRYEAVDQPTLDADAVTVRLRAGLELTHSSGFSVLAEAEGTGAPGDNYNDGNAGNGVEPYSVVADPENIELNRLQIGYANKGFGKVIVGRQRLNIDDQRFVGSVGWRQNEQTFDAVNIAVTALKPITLEGVYAISQRTIWGVDAGTRTAFDGDFIFLGAGADVGPVKVKGFAYLIDYDANEPVALTSTATYGVRATAKVKLGGTMTLDLTGTYATQSDYKANPADYSVDYIAVSAATKIGPVTVTGGYELLGSDGAGNRVQTPMATLHKFNGWADLFLSTPAAGLEDIYAGVAFTIPVNKGVAANVTYHDFNSDTGGISYGSEWDAEVSTKFGPVTAGVKFADYNADGFGTDKQIVWVQLGTSF
jgi:Alginate export